MILNQGSILDIVRATKLLKKEINKIYDINIKT